MVFIRFLIFVSLFAVSSLAAGLHVERWEVAEVVAHSDTVPDDPFAVEFGAVFEDGLGARIRVPGFYNGDNEWMLRFTPATIGTWTYRTFATSPELAGQEGAVTVTANTRSWQRGPIGISKDNPQKFVYADGSPYFLMAFELDWLFALDAENADGIPRTRSIVNDVARHGFNQIVMNVFAYDAGWGEKDKMLPENNFAQPRVFPFGGDNENPDFSTLDVEYFKRLDRVIEHLDEQQIVAHLMIYVWNKKVNWPEPRSEADNRYFDYVVKRYQAYPNLVWDISKEALGYGRDDMTYITDRIDRLRRLDAHARLLSVHDYDYCSAYPEKVDFISIQEWTPYLYDRMLRVKAEHPGKPIFNIEHGGYEQTIHAVYSGAYTDPVDCLDRVYQSFFAGTYGTYYWQNAAWYNVVLEPFALPEEEQPHFHYYRHLTELFSRYEFNTLKPLAKAFVPPALTNKDGSLYLFYIPGGRGGIYGSIQELKGKRMMIQWFDPLTGEYHDGGEKYFERGGWMGIPRPEGADSPLTIAILEEKP